MRHHGAVRDAAPAPSDLYARAARTRYFARELHPRSPPAYPASLAEYLALFAAAEPQQRVGEASPSYLRSHSAAARIAELRPDARIIAVFREPASFLRSLHLELLRDHVETEKDLAAALMLEGVRSQEHGSASSGARVLAVRTL